MFYNNGLTFAVSNAVTDTTKQNLFDVCLNMVFQMIVYLIPKIYLYCI